MCVTRDGRPRQVSETRWEDVRVTRVAVKSVEIRRKTDGGGSHLPDH